MIFMLDSSSKFHTETCLKRKKNLSAKRKWPDEWVYISYKQYPRFFFKRLRYGELSDMELSKTLLRRRSCRSFSREPVGFTRLSKILHYSAGVRMSCHEYHSSLPRDAFRFYASPGARYAAEMYPVVLEDSDIPKGVYHYNVRREELELIFEGDKKNDIRHHFVDDWVHKAPVVLLISSVFSRIQVKYGERGYRYAMFEVGHLAQNILLVATSMKLGACPVGGFIDNELDVLVGNSSHIPQKAASDEKIVYAVAVGFPASGR